MWYIFTKQVALVVKNLPANAGDLKDAGWIPGWGRFPGGGHSNPLQYSCLENPHGQRTEASVHSVAESQTRLKQFSTRASSSLKIVLFGI